ncbi:MAG: tetratricopeptide repeat protein [Bacteroides sp.]|nr:tetratricopeptide repeat protein [Bacteroides sp.]
MPSKAQINTDQTTQIGRNALYFEDYIVAIQYFNQVIAAKPYLAYPYFYRAWAKMNLDDMQGAEEDATRAIERNPFITDAYELRGAARLNLGKYIDAIADYDQALSMLPDNKLLIFNKALAQEQLKDYEAADSSLRQLISRYPTYEGAYTARAKMNLERGDSVSVLADASKAIELNPNATNAYLIRVAVLMTDPDRFADALSDMDKAIRLQPRQSGLYVNRAFIRYKLDDYVGAMADYDYAIDLEPLNTVAIFNRSLLRMEVRDFDNAIIDLNRIIQLRPDDYRALYNRAMIRSEMGQYKSALSDINALIDAFPDLSAAYLMRYEIKRLMGDRSAQRDLDKSIALGKKRIKKLGNNPSMVEVLGNMAQNEDDEDTESQEYVAAQFTQLITMDNDSDFEQEFNNKNIRGKVQDRRAVIDPEPIFVITYYTSPTELKPSGEYMREIDDVNRSHALNYVLQVTNHEYNPTDSTDIADHFQSIDYYNSYLATHTPRAIDYFGRGMNEMTIRNYDGALLDFRRALSSAPDFALAQFMIAVAKYRQAQIAGVATSDLKAMHEARLADVVNEFEKSLELSADRALIYYNIGVVNLDLKNYNAALEAFDKAIELKHDFGEAYFNRGYTHYMMGDRLAGTQDLSRAGQLGIAPAYNLMKRMGS